MKENTGTIAFKLDLRPFGHQELDNPQILVEKLAFCRMLADLIQATLARCLSTEAAKPVTISAVPSGYFGLINVIDAPAAQSALVSLMARYHLHDHCQVFYSSMGGTAYRHVSGPDLGPFESTLEESRQWQSILESKVALLTSNAAPPTQARIP